MNTLPIITHQDTPTLNGATSINVGFNDSLDQSNPPSSPININIPLAGVPGIKSILPITNPGSPNTSVAFLIESGNNKPVALGILDQSSTVLSLKPGETIVYAGGTNGSNSNYIYLDSSGNITIKDNQNNTVTLTSAGINIKDSMGNSVNVNNGIQFKTSTNNISLDSLISQINSNLSIINAWTDTVANSVAGTYPLINATGASLSTIYGTFNTSPIK